MTEYDTEFLAKLKQLCLEYDSKAEFYPESSLEGFALWYFAQHPDHKFSGIGIDYEDYREGKEYREYLDKIWGETKESEQPPAKPHFIFQKSREELDTRIKHFNETRTFKKAEFFGKESPDWLADTFTINEFNIEYGLSGSAKIVPLDELQVIENKDKHEVVSLIIYDGVSLHVKEIQTVTYDD